MFLNKIDIKNILLTLHYTDHIEFHLNYINSGGALLSDMSNFWPWDTILSSIKLMFQNHTVKLQKKSHRKKDSCDVFRKFTALCCQTLITFLLGIQARPRVGHVYKNMLGLMRNTHCISQMNVACNILVKNSYWKYRCCFPTPRNIWIWKKEKTLPIHW